MFSDILRSCVLPDSRAFFPCIELIFDSSKRRLEKVEFALVKSLFNSACASAKNIAPTAAKRNIFGFIVKLDFYPDNFENPLQIVVAEVFYYYFSFFGTVADFDTRV